MKIVLINPPDEYPRKYCRRQDAVVRLPLGLLYVAAVLEQRGYQPALLDSLTLSVDDVYSETKDTIHFGLGWERLGEAVARLSPDVVGITNPFTTQFYSAVKAAEIVKGIAPRAWVMVGGPHASTRPSDFLERSQAIDMCVMGEGEYVVPKVLQWLEGKLSIEGIQGIAYRSNGELRLRPIDRPLDPRGGDRPKDLDELPYPAYHLVNTENYFELIRRGFYERSFAATERAVPVITSRSCPFRCIFCSVFLHMGRGWKAHSSEYVLGHIEHLVHKYGVKHISFEDDNLTLDVKRFERILDGLIERKFNITWDTPNGIRADRLDRELLAKSKRAGCVSLRVSPESGDREVLSQIIRKNLDLDKVVDVARACKALGLPLGAFFIIGFPGERLKNIQNTLRFATMLNRKYDAVPALGIVTPHFGTPLYEMAKKAGYLVKEPTPENLIGASDRANLIKTEDFDPVLLKKLHDRFYWRLALEQFLKPGYLVKAVFRHPRESSRRAWRLLRKTKVITPQAAVGTKS